MSAGTRICHICGTEIGATNPCPTCVAAFSQRLSADEMTGDERVAEMHLWEGPLEVPFDLMHQRIEELVGRPVWTHEMASSVWPMLVDEARTRPGVVDPEAIIGKIDIIKPGMPAIAVVVDEAAS